MKIVLIITLAMVQVGVLAVRPGFAEASHRHRADGPTPLLRGSMARAATAKIRTPHNGGPASRGNLTIVSPNAAGLGVINSGAKPGGALGASGLVMSRPVSPGIGLHPPGLVVIAKSAVASGIDGAKLIRPPLTPSGLGGPAKASTGINGTTMRRKH